MHFPDAMTECFALLDDCDASAAAPRSRLYHGHVGTLQCDNTSGLPALLEEMQSALRNGLHAVGLFSYELGADMQNMASRPDAMPVAQVLLFSRCEAMTADAVEAWLATADQSKSPAGVANLRCSVSEVEFQQAISRIHAYIEAGDTYQINYTYRLHFDAFGTPLALYRRLRARQPVPYGACIALPEGGAILSLSPELFVHYEAGTLTARPMKGTAPANGDAQENQARSAALAADPKNRAENLMIVDLLRNDVGRVARTGSVSVPQLFQVSRHGDVLQMTSTVQAQLRDDVGLEDVFAALYPCGSITGAPKHRSMQIIRELEPDGRGIYTGAIGWFDAPTDQHAVGDFALSVPIRTLALQPPGCDGVRTGSMGVGAGIVHDSDAAAEYAECALKARFLTGLPQTFELFETMRANAGGCHHLDRHLQRLQASAAYFGIAWQVTWIDQAIAQALAQLDPGIDYRLRLALQPDGACTIQTAPLSDITTPVRVLIAPQHTESGDLFLRHKTSVRTTYDAAWRAAEARGAFDMLFFNERGELTEGGRSNVLVRLQGRWYTPPLSAGLLPGVMRAVLLADPYWSLTERVLTLDDLRTAEAVVVCNALRGPLPAVVDWTSPTQ